LLGLGLYEVRDSAWNRSLKAVGFVLVVHIGLDWIAVHTSFCAEVCKINFFCSTTRCVDVQAARGGYCDIVRELLNHGANVVMSLLESPLIQDPVKELLEMHLVVCVIIVIWPCSVAPFNID